MKKSQRLRFLALSALASLTAAEFTEFKQLTAQVALHPNAAEDTEDTETDEDKKKREAKEADEAAKKGKGAAEETEDEKKKREAEEAKAKGAKPSLSACIAAAISAAKGGTSAQLTEQVATLKTERDTANAALNAEKLRATGLETQLTAQGAQLATVCSFLGFAASEISGKNATEVQAVLQAKVSAAATEQVAGLGFAAAALPAPKGDSTATPGTKAELWAAYNALTDSNERAAFYAKHEKKLFA